MAGIGSGNLLHTLKKRSAHAYVTYTNFIKCKVINGIYQIIKYNILHITLKLLYFIIKFIILLYFNLIFLILLMKSDNLSFIQ
jgi:hypothetical protein